MHQFLLPGLLTALMVVVLVRYFVTGNASGACAAIAMSDNHIAVRSGGGLISLFGVFMLVLGAGYGYAAAQMITNPQGNVVAIVVGVAVGSLAVYVSFAGMTTLFERRRVEVDSVLQVVEIEYRLLLPLRITLHPFAKFDRVTLTKKVIGGYRRTTYYKVWLNGPGLTVNLDCDAIYEYDEAVRLTVATASVTALPIEDKLQQESGQLTR